MKITNYPSKTRLASGGKLKIEKFTFLTFLLIFAVSFLLFYPSLNYYFFQDDWFVLNWVRTGNLLSFFEFRTDIIYWRPLSMPIFFWVNYKLFGLNPLGFHLVSFSIFLLLLVSIYKLFLILLEKRSISLLGTFLYSTWPVHFMSLSWISTTSYILMSLFQVLSFLSFVKFTEKRKFQFWIISFTSFLLGLTSHEFTLVLPLIILTWGFLLKKTNYLKFLWPFFLTDLIFLILRFILFPIRIEDDYRMYFNHLIIFNFLWYILWSFNFPERFKDLVDQSMPYQSLKILIRSWQISFTILVMVLILLRLFIKNLTKDYRYYLFGFAWFTTGLLSIITLINHSFTVYLSFAGLGLMFIIATAMKKSNTLLIYLILFSWIVASVYNLDFTRKTHWIVNEQAVSKAFATFTKNKISNPQPNSTILFREADLDFMKKNNFVFIDDLDILKQSLFNQNAMQVIYDDSTIKTYFAKPLQPVNFPSDVTVYDLKPTL